MNQPTTTQDLICLSHLRWDFVYQRPQHLMSRFARARRVFFVEEAIDSDTIELKVRLVAPNIWVIQPHLPFSLPLPNQHNILRYMLDELRYDREIHDYVLWYYTPMALPWTDHLTPRALVYDCMDELSMFQHAPADMIANERALLERADAVFTGGNSLYESKRRQHRNVHCFPSSVNVAHFAQAREPHFDPADQADIPHPRIGFAGVIDERLDIDLIAALSDQLPDTHIVMVGPVVKIDPATLPRRPNVHYLGMKAYEQLPEYMAGWDVALVPFARNDSTRFISPTKTPEYLAAGVPVLSTPIQDVVHPYGDRGLVQIVDATSDLRDAVAQALAQQADPAWRDEIDTFLAPMSWDATHAAMDAEIRACISLADDTNTPLSVLELHTPVTRLSA